MRETAEHGSYKVPVRYVHIRNFLSLQDVEVNLKKLNVLVGPNGGGKSNFLSVFQFLGEVARVDLGPALHNLFGGYNRVICRAESVTTKNGIHIFLKGEITEYSSPTALDEYSLKFRPSGITANGLTIWRNEEILLKRSAGRGRRISLKGGKYEYETVGLVGKKGVASDGASGKIGSNASALSVLRRIGARTDTEQLNQLADVFEDLRLFDPNVEAARRQSDPSEGARLDTNASNLGAVLMKLRDNHQEVLDAIQDDIRYVLPGFKSLEFARVGADAVRIGIKEAGIKDVTPIRFASYGTVRSIALFTMLRDPNPPRLTCLEEVDHGLHPHALDVLVERLRDAAGRSQIIVATHSPALVNRLEAEELIVFERNRESGVTEVPKLDLTEIKQMEEESEFRLGELWYSGLLGGYPR